MPKAQKATFLDMLTSPVTWYRFRLRARYLDQDEWYLDNYDPDLGLVAKFYGPRRLVAAVIYLSESDEMTLEELKVQLDDDTMEAVPFSALYAKVNSEPGFILMLKRPVLCRGFSIKPPHGESLVQHRIAVRVAEDEYVDRDKFVNGLKLANDHEFQQAERSFLEYVEMCPENPLAHRELSLICHQLEQPDRALGYALAALMLDASDAHFKLYRILRSNQPTVDAEELSGLNRRLEKWALPMSEGIVILDRRAEYYFGERNELLTKVRQILQIRRYAAARLLRSLSFPYQSHRQSLLYTGCALYRDGEVRSIDPDDRFHVADDEDRNSFITVQNLKQGWWILPDLKPNDIVVLEYDLIERVKKDDGRPAVFKLIRPFSEMYPLLQSSVSISGPLVDDVDAIWVNQEYARGASLAKEESDGTIALRLTEFTPARYTSLRNEDNLLNPLIALGSKGRGWDDIAKRCLRDLGSAGLEKDLLPDVLRAVMNPHDTEEKKLAAAFYWIRDRLKYASLKTTNANVGGEDRARLIVQSGTGDCKDRAYLMALVCRELGMDWSFVMVNSQDEVVIPEIPEDQFDHVIIRVRDGARDRYLDPTSSSAVFGSAPYWQQGHVVLVLSEKPELTTTPEDDPGQNALEVYESLDSLSDGWLVGGFDCTATGHIARLTDELWKQASLTDTDQVRAAQRLAQYVMDSVVVRSFEKVADTGKGDVFRMTGRHRRCPLTAMPGGTDVATLDWNIPFIAVSYLRTLTHAGRFHFAFPARVKFVTVLGPRVAGRVAELSALEPLDNPLARISESVSHDGDSIKIVRETEIKHKVVTGKDIDYIDPTLECLEKALRVVMRLKRDEQ